MSDDPTAATNGRRNAFTGTPWEVTVGYCRAVRVGNHVFVSGTTASDEDGNTVAVGRPYDQARFILARIEAALRQLGAELSDVVRTRMFVTDITLWEEFGRAHGEAFRDVMPAATMVEVSRLINPEHLIEIEVDAVITKQAGR
jgi:enamine deaminase RidA (YjgF/YER057c/UK114 family)